MLSIKLYSTKYDLSVRLAKSWGGKDHVAIYADAFASLHGRQTQRLIDPTVNLLSSKIPSSWIIPLKMNELD